MIFPAIPLGDFVAERAVQLGLVPEYASEGEQARALRLLVSEDVSLTRLDHWALQLGKIARGKFQVLASEIALDGALSANVVRRYELPDPVLLRRGDVFAVRLSPRGQPAPLSGVSLVVEWGVHSTRRSTRV